LTLVAGVSTGYNALDLKPNKQKKSCCGFFNTPTSGHFAGQNYGKFMTCFCQYFSGFTNHKLPRRMVILLVHMHVFDKRQKTTTTTTTKKKACGGRAGLRN
jgi:hypothetical protein